MPASFRHQLFLLGKRLALCFAVYFVCRLVFYLVNLRFFPGSFGLFLSDAFYALRFDAFSITVSNSLFILLSILPLPVYYSRPYQRTLFLLYLIANTVFVSFNLIDVAYFPFIRKRSTADLFSQMGGQTDIAALLPSFAADFWWVAVLLVLCLGALWKGYPRVRKTEFPEEKNKKGHIAIGSGIAAVLLLGLLSVRGGISGLPIDMVDAGAAGKNARPALVLNTPFSLIKSLDQKPIPVYHFYSKKELQTLYDPVHHFKELEPAQQNLVVIILESFSKAYTGLGGKKSYTPFLDSLMQYSRVYTNGFSNSTKSIEGIPAILSSLPSLSDIPYINSIYANNRQTSFATLLGAEGYATAFFHGANNGVMNFTKWAMLAGYQNYYGRDEYNNDADYDGSWGIYDGPFLNYCAKKISGFKQPFHAAVFTLSSHHPYSIPEADKKKYVGAGKVGAALLYADHALREFFTAAKKSAWFSNTLFVLTADHATIQKELFISNPSGNLSIPIVFYRPDNSLKGKDRQVFGQVDILPEVMKLMGYNKKFFALGKDPAKTKGNLVCHYTDGTYQLFTDSMFYVFNGPQLGKAYNYLRDSSLSKNITGKFPLADEQVTHSFRAMLQAYHHMLINNEGLVKDSTQP